MTTFKRRFAAVVCGVLGMSGGGCLLATDLINPNLLSSIGFDPDTVIAPQGRIVVAFTNSTSAAVAFVIAVSDDPADPTANARAVSTDFLESGETRSLVLDCPVGVITPGAPSADFSTDTVAAVAVTDADAVDIVYTGTPVVVGTDMACGDVLEIEAVQFGIGDGVVFGLQLQVLPGR